MVVSDFSHQQYHLYTVTQGTRTDSKFHFTIPHKTPRSPGATATLTRSNVASHESEVVTGSKYWGYDKVHDSYRIIGYDRCSWMLQLYGRKIPPTSLFCACFMTKTSCASWFVNNDSTHSSSYPLPAMGLWIDFPDPQNEEFYACLASEQMGLAQHR